MSRTLAAALTLALPAAAIAQTAPFAPPAAPQWPALTPVSPAGGTRGTAVEVTLTGARLANVTGVRLGQLDLAFKPIGDGNLTRLALSLPADFTPATWPLRVVTAGGVSEAVPFWVDDLPTVTESADPHDGATTGQRVPVPASVEGTCRADKAAYFRFDGRAGEAVRLEVVARRLGSSADPVLTLYRGDGREMPGLTVDDAPGCLGDARVAVTLPEAGTYAVAVHDQQFRGGDAFRYRLRLGRFPFATTALPAESDDARPVAFAGPDADIPMTAVAAFVNLADAVPASPQHTGGHSGVPVEVRRSADPQRVEVEPNDSTPEPLATPAGVTGRFLTKGDRDRFRVTLKKGQTLTATARTAEILSPAEVYITLTDAKGAEVARSDPAQPLARLTFAAPADGHFVLTLEHLNYLYGTAEAYHLSVSAGEPSLTFKLADDRVAVNADGTGWVAVTSLVRTGGSGPVTLSARVHGREVGTVTVADGAFTPAPGLPVTLLPVSAAGLAPGAYPLDVVALSGGREFRTDPLDRAKVVMPNVPFPPAWLGDRLTLAVLPPAGFTLSARLDGSAVAPGGGASLLVAATRHGYDGEIPLTVVAAPPGVTLRLAPIAKGTTSVRIPFTVDTKAATGVRPFALRGTARLPAGDFAAVSNPLSLSVIQPGEPLPRTPRTP